MLNKILNTKTTPAALLEGALGAFTLAEAKMEAAVLEIQRQEEAIVAEQAALQLKFTEASTTRERLERIKQRFADILA